MGLDIDYFLPKHVTRALGIGPVPEPVARRFALVPEKIDPNHLPTGQRATAPIECILVGRETDNLEQLNKTLAPFMKTLSADGQISLIFKNVPDNNAWFEQLDLWLAAHQLIRYHSGPLDAGHYGQLGFAVVAVSGSYNPVDHARQVAAMGKPDLAVDIIDAIPTGLIPDTDTLAKLNVEAQKFCLVAQQLQNKREPVHAHYYPQHRKFAQATALSPLLHDAYQHHARYWHLMGNTQMAVRVLRSIQHVQPNNDTQRLLLKFQEHPQPSKRHQKKDLPEWLPTDRKPRILVITHNYSDYGMDTLFHGLCNLLGKENVVEFPWKPTLHGQQRDSANNYPCFFEYPGSPLAMEHLLAELHQGRFDLIIYADVVEFRHQDQVRAILNAAGDVPVILYDTWDDCYTPVKKVLAYLGRTEVDVSFKRELLEGVVYETDPLPLPFSYPEVHALETGPAPKTEPFFWAGKKDYGLRQIYIPYLARRFGRQLDRLYDQKTYRSTLRHSLIGLSFFGCGFDTVRYWELPANGVMLLAERLPIVIPYDFVDGESAVFFDDLPDLEAKLDYYLRHPRQAQRIAAAGHAHYLKHHTSTARARQFLGAVYEALGPFVR